MSSTKRVDQILDQIVGLIARDVDSIDNGTDAGLGDKEGAALCRYATTLAGIKAEKSKSMQSEKDDLDSQYTDQELSAIESFMDELVSKRDKE